jgi:hypothetical protein
LGNRLLGEYGVDAIQATYDVTPYSRLGTTDSCRLGTTTRETTVAPTNVEGWRLTIS